ncbi:MAG TPA: DedA family protein [Kofleriaceae bacterium]|nr:DedA family protein [Kofleriaceae bacterium]
MTEQLMNGSLLFVFAWLAIGGLGVPLPEDAAILAAGVLIEKGAASPILAVLVVALGVLGGDAVLFFAARRLGPAAYERKLFQRLLPPERRAKVDSAYDRYGGRLVFIARHVAGLRAAVFAMAGIHGMRPARFLLWDAAAAAISIPFVIGLGYYGARHVDKMRAGMAAVHHYILLASAILVLGFITWRHLHLRAARLRAP